MSAHDYIRYRLIEGAIVVGIALLGGLLFGGYLAWRQWREKGGSTPRLNLR